MKAIYFATFLTYLTFSGLLSGQTTTALEIGQKPYGSYHGGDIDTVNLSNGNVDLHIPLISFPQRGSLALDFFIRNTNKNWVVDVITGSHCAAAFGQCLIEPPHRTVTTQFQRWVWAGTGVTIATSQDWNYVAQGGVPEGGTIPSASASITDPSGAIHSLVWPGDSSSGLTADGTGIRLQVDQAGELQIVDRKGTVFTSTGGDSNHIATHSYLVTDANGNQITRTVNYPQYSDVATDQGWTDSAGRVIPGGIFSDHRGPFHFTPSNGGPIPYITSWTPGVVLNGTEGCPSGTASAQAWSPPLPQNQSGQYLFCFSDVSVSTQFTQLYYDPEAQHSSQVTNASLTLRLLTAIVLPNSQQWVFAYDNYAELVKVTLPTGGSISYGWTTISDPYGSQSRYVQSRAVDANDGNGPHTWSYSYNLSPSTLITTVTDPEGNETVHTFGLSTPWGAFYETQTDTYQGSSASGILLKRDVNAYTFYGNTDYALGFYGLTEKDSSYPLGGSFLTTKTTKVFDNDQVAYAYGGQTGGQIPVSYGSVLSESLYDYGASAPFRVDTSIPQWRVDARYLNANMLDIPASFSVTDPGKSTTCSQTAFGYDDPAYLLVSSSNLPQHGPSPFSVRGNLATRTRSLYPNACHGGGASQITDYTYYYDSGEVQGTQDPLGFRTSQLYDATGVFRASSTNALGQSTTETHDLNSGLQTALTDLNGHSTSINYDLIGRPTIITYPEGFVQFSYDDVAHEVKERQSIDAARTRDETIRFDGLGRQIQANLTSDPQGGDLTDTSFDALGRVKCVSNPHRSSPSSTDGASCTTYDALGRKTSLTQPDASVKQFTYAANATTEVDEAGGSTTRIIDAAARLTQVSETGSRYTNYTYDPLGNLVSVVQQGINSETARSRLFSYDSFSRLLTAQNPETGVICYGSWNSGTCSNGYDANGNLLSRTDARGVVTSYSYDALNRLTYKRYSDGTLLAAFGYDGNVETGAPASSMNATSTNAIGRVTSISDQSTAAAVFSYDSMGRLNLQQNSNQGEPRWSTQVQATYNFAGNLTSLIYPDGRQIQQTFDGAGHLSAIGSNGITQNLLQSIMYNPDASPQAVTLGNGIVQSIAENNRLQVAGVTVADPLSGGGTTYLSRTYCYSTADCSQGGAANNGNIWQITDNKNSARTQAFSYDGLNRIQNFSLDGAVKQQYGIDSFGNMTPIVNNQALYSFDPSTNRIVNLPCSSFLLPYDLAGNQTCDTDANGGLRSYVYDAENRIASISTQGSGTPFEMYSYGADGARTRKTNADGTFTEYVSFAGQAIAEKDQTGAWTDYVYANGKKIAMVQGVKPTIHLHGIQTQGAYGVCGTPWYVNGQADTSLPYTVQAGDVLTFDYKDIAARSGVWLGFGAGRYNDGSYSDDLTDYAPDGAWHHRNADLSGYAGQTATTIVVGPGAPTTPVGPYDAWIQNIMIQSQDGSIHPLFSGGAASGSVWGTCGNTDLSLRTESTPVDDLRGTTFYSGDHLGSAQLEFSASGTPLSFSQFAPFGAEINPQVTANHYKFTGKERDTESGLDYFGARYYASSMGRFMSPDWSSRPTPVPYANLRMPQTLNLYSYAGNNPLGGADPDGHCDWCQKLKNFVTFNGWNTNAQVAANKATVTTTQGDGVALQHQQERQEQIVNSLANAGPAMAAQMILDPFAWADGSAEAVGEMESAATSEAAAAAEGATTGEAAAAAEGAATSGPKPSPNFIEPTNPPQNPPSSVPDGHSVRVMGPTEQYKNGYWVQTNQNGQPINPATGKPTPNVSRAVGRSQTHVPLPPKE